MIFRDLTILGAGTIVPFANHGCSGYLLRTDRGAVLLDCGPGILYRLTEVGTAATEIDNFLISHFHLDHISDLGPLLNSRWLRSPGKQDLRIVGPYGMGNHLTWLSARLGGWFSDYRLSVYEMPDGENPTEIVAGMKIQTVQTHHTPESICYRLEDEEGRVIFYSGDTDYNEELVPLARGADIALIECSMPDDAKMDGHLTPLLAAKLAQLADVKELVLTHFYREVTEVDIQAQASKVFRGRIRLAEDLMRIPFDERRPTNGPRASL